MQKQRVISVLVLVTVLGLASPAFAQIENPAFVPHRTPGYFNSDTGLFEPLHPMAQDEVSHSVTPTTGTLVFNFTITLKSTLPKNGIVLCGAGAEVSESTFSAVESGAGFASLVSGDTYSCTVTIPYSWLLSTPSSDKIALSYKAEIVVGIQISATNGTGNTVMGTSGRASSQTVSSIAVPVNGATTSETVSVTL